MLFTPQPSGLEGYCRHGPGGRAGGRVGVRAGGRAGGCQTCGTHISVNTWWIFSIQSSVELSRPVGVHCHGHMPICPIWACPWAKNLSNLPQIGFRLIWPWPWIFKVKFWKCCISGMEGPIDMKRKGCESIGCYTNFVTFNVPLTHDLDLGFSRSNFE